jgi:trk system potassium uptake protein TrkH
MYVDEVETNPRRIIRSILVTTLLIEFSGFMILRARFKVLGIMGHDFNAFFHSVSAFCNAGFSTFSDSLNRFTGDYWVNLSVIGLVVSGGIGFVVMQDLGKVFMRMKRHTTYHTRIVLWMTAILILLGMAIFYMLEYDRAYASLSIPGKLLAALFQSVTPRTAGFDTIPQVALSLPSMVVVIALMFTGGSPGSTAGGIKTTTLFMAVLSAFGGQEDDGSVSYQGGALSPGSVAKAFSILVKAGIVVGTGFVALLVLEGGSVAFGDLLFETVSAFGTVGLSRGVTAQLGRLSRLVVIAVMFIGRVGLFAMAITRSNDRVERFADYPQENLLIG